MKGPLCGNGIHDVTQPGATVTVRHARGHLYDRCRECWNAAARRHKQKDRCPRKPNRPIADTAEDFTFLMETGLQPRQIAVKLDMRYPSLLQAIARAGIELEWDKDWAARIK